MAPPQTKNKGQPLGTLLLTLGGLVLVVSLANPKLLVSFKDAFPVFARA